MTFESFLLELCLTSWKSYQNLLHRAWSWKQCLSEISEEIIAKRKLKSLLKVVLLYIESVFLCQSNYSFDEIAHRFRKKDRKSPVRHFWVWFECWCHKKRLIMVSNNLWRSKFYSASRKIRIFLLSASLLLSYTSSVFWLEASKWGCVLKSGWASSGTWTSNLPI